MRSRIFMLGSRTLYSQTVMTRDHPGDVPAVRGRPVAGSGHPAVRAATVTHVEQLMAEIRALREQLRDAGDVGRGAEAVAGTP
jgi:hypothetical protein